MTSEEAATELDCERKLLQGILPGRAKKALDKALTWAAELYRGEELYYFLRETFDLTEDEITASGFDLQEYYLGDVPECDFDTGEEDEIDGER